MTKEPLSYNSIDAAGLNTILVRYQDRNHEDLITDFEVLASTRLLNKPAVAVSSGTAALHLALVSLGIGRGDYVVVPTFSYVAAVNPVLYLGAKPVWIDAEERTWNLCPDLLEKALRKFNTHSKRIKAIIAVHNYGVPAEMDKIMKLSRQYSVPVIEDAAEAWGASINGKPCGIIGDIGVFSFNNNKTVTAFGGGLVTTRSTKLEKRVRFLAAQARLPKPYYVFDEIGYNYRMSPLIAAYGLLQLERDAFSVHKRRQVFQQYASYLSNVHGLTWAEELDGHIASRWLSAFRYPNQTRLKRFIKSADSQGIEIRIGWNPLHKMKHVAKFPRFLNGTAEALFNEVLCLPSGVNQSDNEQQKVINELLNNLGYKRAI